MGSASQAPLLRDKRTSARGGVWRGGFNGRALFSHNIQMSVKVGVRVRPFNQRESDLNCRLCVDMIGNMTRLFNADQPDKHRDFTFDYSFWSHDQFHTIENGYFEADGDKYADQQNVFNAVGIQILSNAWEGYHCCLFAYGQTGAGKSYSMVGYGANKGIVPISCEEIFKRIESNPNKNKEYQVNVSMMEIYNERVQDLLIPISKRPKEGHKIREHKTLGIYVEGMSKHLVETYDEIEYKMEEGGKNRSIAATEMNASSSRAHTIISIQFKQIETSDGKKREKLSVIYLVDLAGSEKVGKTGATGDRLKEAAGINKSLSVLGLVISTLADNAMAQGKAAIVPYRNSCLTRILQNALGGNSKTLMICAISPATDNYEETLSTLRYADQAKKIQNKAVINESETDKIIRTLKEEKEELILKMKIMEDVLRQMSLGKAISPEMLVNFNDIKEELRFNDQKINDYTMTREERKQHEGEEEHEPAFDLRRPHLSNLHGDSQVSRKVNYIIDNDQTTIGKLNKEPPNDIKISGMNIKPLHAQIFKEEGEFWLKPNAEEGHDTNCYINGDPINNQTQLMHLDRFSIGQNMFLVIIPGGEPRNENLQEMQLDYEFAQQELYTKNQVYAKNERDRDREVESNDQLLKFKQQEKEENLKMQQQLKEMQDRLILKENNEEEVKKKMEVEINKLKKHIQEQTNQNKAKTRRKYDFNDALAKALAICVQINLIAKELKRNVVLTVKIILDKQEDINLKTQDKSREMKVKVVNKEVGYTYWWDEDKLENRFSIIKQISEKYFEDGQLPKLTEKDDPFWDPPEHSIIGCCYLTTKSLAYMFDNPVVLPITGDEHCGELEVNVMPTDETGKINKSEELEMEEVEFEPEDHLNRPLYFKIYITKGKIPNSYEKVFVEYSLKVDEENTETFKTPIIEDRTSTPFFGYQHLHMYANITNELLEYLTSTNLIFKVCGVETFEPEVMVEPKKSHESKLKGDLAFEQKHRAEMKGSVTTNSSFVEKGVAKGKGAEKEVEAKPAAKMIPNDPQKMVPSMIKVKEPIPGGARSNKTATPEVNNKASKKDEESARSNKTATSEVNNKTSKKDEEKAKKDACIIY